MIATIETALLHTLIVEARMLQAASIALQAQKIGWQDPKESKPEVGATVLVIYNAGIGFGKWDGNRHWSYWGNYGHGSYESQHDPEAWCYVTPYKGTTF